MWEQAARRGRRAACSHIDTIVDVPIHRQRVGRHKVVGELDRRLQLAEGVTVIRAPSGLGEGEDIDRLAA